MNRKSYSRNQVLSGTPHLPKAMAYVKGINFQALHCTEPIASDTTFIEISCTEIRKFEREAVRAKNQDRTIEKLKLQLEAERTKNGELKKYIESHRKSEANLLTKVRLLENNIDKINENIKNPIDERRAPRSPKSHTSLIIENGTDLRSKPLSAGLPSLGKKR